MINEKLNSLFECWKAEMNKAGHRGFCYDGLIYRNGEENKIWKNSTRRIVFLLKEQNDNDGEDVREWSGSINGFSPNNRFYNRLSAWLYGLTHATATGYPARSLAFDNHTQMKALSSYPYAYVNLKKQSGGSRAKNREIKEHALLYKNFLRKQLDILDGKIIVCGGKVVFNIARDLIFSDLIFTPINDWIYYNSTKELVLIDSFHPSDWTKPPEQMYDWMMEKFVGFLNKKHDS